VPTDIPFDLDAIEVRHSLQFAVLWSKGKRLEGAQVGVGGAVTEHLQRACRATVGEIRDREPFEYSPDMQLEPEEYAVVTDNTLVADSPIGAVLLSDTRLPLIDGHELANHMIRLYAVLVGVGDGRRAFVKKRSPQVNVKPGWMLTTLGDVLMRLDTPVLTLDESFDLIASPQGVVALQQKVFEDLFKDAQVLQERVPVWVQDVMGHIPMGNNLAERLTAKCQRDSRFRRRLYAMRERGHLAHLTLHDLRGRFLTHRRPSQQWARTRAGERMRSGRPASWATRATTMTAV